MMKSTLTAAALLVGLSLPALSSDEPEFQSFHYLGKHGSSDSAVEFTASSYWSSKYLSKGRSLLDKGEGLVAMDAAVSYNNWTLAAWYAVSDSSSFDELDIIVAYNFELGDFDGYLAYTRVELFDDNWADDEFELGVAYNGWDKFDASATYIYSRESSGGYLELELAAPIEVIEERLTVTPFIQQAFDFGYVQDDSDFTLNHFQVGVVADLTITENWNLFGRFDYSWSQDGLKDLNHKDQSRVAAGFAYSF
ncbi:hypothetical protein [Persicirhabdus sediminis]|uniref:Porin n=1 Tax=Persicirhabdus sediminis TaxID=454144 RepID=A0A8J7MCY1_9BACT|nr:hypothetical protein [Persicirhabdus sediminis]MBK1790222.1 hypothetical protein [Persicirhabdus sediminis]